jgi:cytochrome c oxidase assembly factor CtaG
MWAQQVTQPRRRTPPTHITMIVTVAVMLTIAMAMAVIVYAALRLGHASQHARARPSQHIDNDQPVATAKAQLAKVSPFDGAD